MKTVKYKKYSKYKDSCVEWFTEIPEGWDVVKTKYIAKTIAGGTPSTSVAEYWDGGDIPWLPSGKVQNCNIEEADIFITKLGLRESATKRINRNSVLVALTGATCANAGYLTFCATANQSVVALHEYKNKADSRFLFYSLLSQREQILVFKSGGAQGGVSDKTIASKG